MNPGYGLHTKTVKDAIHRQRDFEAPNPSMIYARREGKGVNEDIVILAVLARIVCWLSGIPCHVQNDVGLHARILT